MARELSENNRARSDGEESPGGLSMQSSSNYLAPSEPPGSEVSALEMSQDEDYHSCDADAGLEVEEEVEASEELVADEDRALISEMPEGTQDEDTSRWKPGSNCGSFLDKFNPVTPQSLVLLGNVYTNLAKVPVNLLKKVADYLPRREKFMRCSWLVVVVAEIFAVSYASVKTWIQDLKQQQWVPRKRQSVAEFKKQNAKESEISLAQDVVEKLNPRDSNEQIMKNLVSRALFLCCEGQSSLAYERDISNLLSMVGREQLGDQHHSRKFFIQVVYMAARVLEKLEALRINSPIAGLGIASDFGLAMDPVSLGSGVQARHETVLVICLCLIGSHGKMYTSFLCAPTLPLEGHTGDSLRELSLEALAQHPCGFSNFSLKRRLAVVSGDGNLAKGGNEAAHSSTKTCEKIWQATHPDMNALLTSWDRFHRFDSAVWRACMETPLTEEVFDLAAALDSLFGMCEGKALLRSVGSLLHEAPRTTRRAGGTRKIGYISGVPSHMLANFKHYILGLHARIAWRKQGVLAHLFRPDVGSSS